MIGGKPPRYLNDQGRALPVDRGRLLLPPGSLAEGIVTLTGQIRVQKRVFTPPARWSWGRYAGPILRFLRHLPAEAGPEVLPLFWDRWPRLKSGEEFAEFWLDLLQVMGHPLPSCRLCGQSMANGGDPGRWICTSCGGKEPFFAVLSAFIEREFGLALAFPPSGQDS